MKQKIFVDESGSNGIIKYDFKKKSFNYDQRYFTLCLFLPNKDNAHYIEKYGIDISVELKGSEIMTQRYNTFLEDFIKEFINDKEFYITLYDKKFLVASFLAFNVLGEAHKRIDPQFHFTVIELFFNQSDSFFEPFFLTCKFPNKDNAEKLLEYLINYKYEDIREDELVLPHLKLMLQNYLMFPETAIKAIVYEFETTLLNVNMIALGESLSALKSDNRIITNKNIEVYHDESITILDIVSEAIPNLNIEFVKSDNDIMIQIADNVASIFNKTQKEIMNNNYKNIKIIRDSWHFKQFVTLSKLVKPENIKYCFDLATGTYLRALAYYRTDMSVMEYNFTLKSLFEDGFKSLKAIDFDVEKGLETLRE